MDTAQNSPQSQVANPVASAPAPASTAPADPTAAGTSNGGLVGKAKQFLADKVLANQPTVAPSDPPLAHRQQPATTKPLQQPQPASTSSTPGATKTKVAVKGMANLVDALEAKGLISSELAKQIKLEAVSYNRPVEQLVEEKTELSGDQVQRVRAEMRGVGFIDLTSVQISPSVLQQIPRDIAERSMAVAFDENKQVLKVGMVDPLDLQKIQYLESVARRKIDAYFASREDVRQVINTRYGAEIGSEVDKALESVADIYDVDASKQQVEQESGKDAPVIRIVNMVLDYAAKHGASDIHIEPREGQIGVRYRINGVLSEKLTIPKELAGPVVTRIKILANMKIDEHRLPQDGRFPIKIEDKMIDIRASAIPTVYGEKVVMRLLEKGGGVMTLENAGMRGKSLELFKQHLQKTQGIILVTGPTGSGKTQTLASCLKILNKPEVNTMTLEDPVEIRIDGVNQVQINNEVGLTFASGLRSFLRQDPDIIMVGEIRDAETAKLAIQAALTGHLVLATLHTNSAAGALPRLIDMGVESYLLASTINVVVAQRLVRRVNSEKAAVYAAESEEMQKLHQVLDPLDGFELKFKSGNLKFDRNTEKVNLLKPTKGAELSEFYSGRMGIFEVLDISDNISRMIVSEKSEADIHQAAVESGMMTMVQDGFIKSLQGMTTIEEVLRVIN